MSNQASALTRAGEGVRRATAKRNDLIAEAVADGMTQREVARLVGLSHTAVQIILRRRAAS